MSLGHPGAGPSGSERRKHRSSDALVALSHLLESARSRSGLPALAIADETGVLVAGAGAFQACEELAAVAPLLIADVPANDGSVSSATCASRSRHVRRVRVSGVNVLVCSEADATRSEPVFPELIDGCRRILSATAR